MKNKCQKCGNEFNEKYIYHNLLNNELWCFKCAKKTTDNLYVGGCEKILLNVFAKRPKDL